MRTPSKQRREQIEKQTSVYNATAYHYDLQTGTLVSTEAVQVNEDGVVIRACGLWTVMNGTLHYATQWAWKHRNYRTEIAKDGAQGYRNALRGLAIPPAYKTA